MAGITSSTGLGSGLDIAGLVSQLVSAEGQPAALSLNKKEVALQTDLSALGTLKGALSSFQTAVKGLKLESSFQPRTATSSNTDLFTASAGSAAVPGGFSIQVNQLAQAAKMRSGDFTNDKAIMGAGTLTFGLGDKSFNITTDGTTTLAGVRDAINSASDNPGIKATIINVDSGSRLVLTSDKLGAANTITVAANDSDANDGNDLGRLASANLVTLQAPSDAIIHVDGQQVTKDSNTFTDVISGVSINLKKADPAKTETLTIDLDKDAAKTKINDFIKAYNAMSASLGALGSYDATTKKGGPLLGDSTLRGVQNQVRQALSNPVAGMDGVKTLAEIGIKTNKEGALELDETRFNKVMASNPDAIGKLFTSEGGLAKRFDNMLTNYLSSTGSLTARVEGINKQINGIDDQRTKLDTRMADLKARLTKQFTAMDSLLGQLNATGSYLSQQLANLPGFVDNSNN
jgi:flagellar hook-associated protein 2